MTNKKDQDNINDGEDDDFTDIDFLDDEDIEDLDFTEIDDVDLTETETQLETETLKGEVKQNPMDEIGLHPSLHNNKHKSADEDKPLKEDDNIELKSTSDSGQFNNDDIETLDVESNEPYDHDFLDKGAMAQKKSGLSKNIVLGGGLVVLLGVIGAGYFMLDSSTSPIAIQPLPSQTAGTLPSNIQTPTPRPQTDQITENRGISVDDTIVEEDGRDVFAENTIDPVTGQENPEQDFDNFLDQPAISEDTYINVESLMETIELPPQPEVSGEVVQLDEPFLELPNLPSLPQLPGGNVVNAPQIPNQENSAITDSEQIVDNRLSENTMDADTPLEDEVISTANNNQGLQPPPPPVNIQSDVPNQDIGQDLGQNLGQVPVRRVNQPIEPLGDEFFDTEMDDITLLSNVVDPGNSAASKYVYVQDVSENGGYESLLVSAERALKLKRYMAALDFYDRLYDQNAGDQRVLAGRALALQKMGRIDEAATMYETLLERDDSNVNAVLNYVGLLKERFPEDALRKLLELRRSYPNNAVVAAQTGVIYANLGNMNDAIRLLEIAITINPKDPLNYYNLAVLYDREESYRRAVQYYEEALQIDAMYGDTKKLNRDIIYDRLASIR